MIATEPLPPEVWAQIGLDRAQTFHDARHLIVYGQRTTDDRLAFGGRGAPYHLRSSIRPSYDQVASTAEHLQRELVDLFPVLDRAEITHRWGGPLGVPRDWHPSVGLDPDTGIGWAGGYVGDGVAHDQPRRPHARRPGHGRRLAARPSAVGGPPLPALGARAAALGGDHGCAAGRRVGRPHRASGPGTRAASRPS